MSKKTSENVVTIKDIAAMCGVSISTVSNVLNKKNNKVSEEVAKKIQDAVVQTGYHPNYLAKSLRSISTKTIGVIVEDLLLFTSTSVIEGLMNRCEESGYNVVIENMRLFGRWHGDWMRDEALFQSALQPVLSKMDSMNVDGILYVGGHEHIVHHLKSLSNLPIVMTYAIAGDSSIPTFRLDDYNGGYDAYTYLLSKGHKRIGVLAGEPDNTHTINRMQGIQKAMFEAGILYDPALVIYGHWTKESGCQGMKQLLSEKVTAVFCMSDAIGTGAYAALKEANLEPGRDVAIMGYDNQDISSFLSPMMTTMALPLEEMGYESAGKLINIIEGNDNNFISDIRLKATLVERESV